MSYTARTVSHYPDPVASPGTSPKACLAADFNIILDHSQRKFQYFALPLFGTSAGTVYSNRFPMVSGHPLLVAGISLISEAKPAVSAGTMLLDVVTLAADGSTEVSLLTAQFDVTTLTAKVTSGLTLTGTTANLQIDDTYSLAVKLISSAGIGVTTNLLNAGLTIWFTDVS